MYTFANDKAHTHVIPKQDPEVEELHSGSDFGLVQAFIEAVQKADNGELSVEDARRRFVGCDLDEIIVGHAVNFAPGESRMSKKAVDFRNWWAQKLSEHERSVSERKQSEDELELGDGLDRLKNE